MSMKPKQKIVCLSALCQGMLKLRCLFLALLFLDLEELVHGQGLPNDCPSLPPLVQVFCGNPSNAFECILDSWVCDGNLDCSTNLDESDATCNSSDPCINHQCQNGGACEGFAADERSVAYYVCHCAEDFTGQHCDSHASNTTDDLTTEAEATAAPTTTAYTTPEAAATTTATPKPSPDTSDMPPLTTPDTPVIVPTPDPLSCQPNPCLNGVCTPLRNGFHCSCRPGFTGTICNFGINVCESFPCINGGTCQRTGESSYDCRCVTGFAGRQCELQINECDSSPCDNGGTCVDHLNGYTCTCPAGYTGRRCQSGIDHCASSPCDLTEGGRCVNDLLTYRCQCSTTRAGQYCERDQLCGTGDPCLNYGVCYPPAPPDQPARCDCLPGFTGRLCETNIEDCLPGVCGPNGQCVDSILDYRCVCHSGYTGQHCELEIDPCQPNPCQNKGYCCRHGKTWCGGRLPKGYFECYCADSFTGTLCEERPDPCSPDPCRNRGLCNKIGTSYLCTCPLVFTGQHCETAIPCASQPCLNNATCVDTGGDYQCQCDSTHYGRYCQALQPCLSNPCRNDAICINDGNSYQCQCSSLHTGRDCESLLPCASSPCLNAGQCIDQKDGFTCLCSDQYTGETCDVPLPCTDDPCGDGGVCEVAGDSFTCQCFHNFTGSTCETFLPCASQPCLNGAPCLTIGEDFECDCSASFTGKQCEVFLPCASQPCFNDGACSTVGVEDFTCDCGPVFTGTRCETSLACASKPCQNNGQCQLSASGYTCDCTPAYSGSNCEMFLPCTTEPCRNGGQCTNLVDGTHKCLCPPEFTGTDCELSTLCIPNPCLAGGECSVEGATINCKCVPPYTGSRCEIYDACLAVPCQNGGTCSSSSGGSNTYQCVCTAAFTGPDCEVYLHCSSSPCLNGGSCENLDDDYACSCTEVFGGRNCETPIPCGSNPCLNLASCENRGNTYQCVCQNDYTGVRCETPLPCASSPCVRGQCNNVPADGTGYTCECEPSFTGHECESPLVCDEDTCINGQCVQSDATQLLECVCDPGYTGLLCDTEALPCDSSPCLNGGTCSNTDPEGFDCTCPPAYSGARCERRLLPCDSQPCLYGGTCSNVDDSYVCSCAPSYTGARCEHLEGICDSDPCQNGGRCVEDGTTFTCICRPPYTGRTCEAEIASCIPDPCENGGSCFVDPLGIFCECSSPFEGLLCQWKKGVCDPNPCQNFGECWQTKGTALCDCVKGYQGQTCEEEVAGCEPNPCSEGDCVEDSRTGKFQCSCPPEWLGSQCQIRNPCHSQPCVQGATCVAVDADYACYCPIGYTGQSCDSQLSACYSAPCRQDGTCRDNGMTDSFSCICVAGYTGATCETNVNDCQDNDFCQNSGECVDLVAGFRCDCQPGFSGQYCTVADSCLTNPCVNSIECLNTPNPPYGVDYTCVCRENYSGANCQLFNFCISQPCRNAGTCSNEVDTFRCRCPDFYTGSQCEEELSGCQGVACSGRGQCVSQGQGGYRCECTGGYSGVDCELTPCDSNPCLNGGTCILDHTGWNCRCPQSWAGSSCDIATSELAPSFSSQAYLQLPVPERVSSSTTFDLTIYPRGPDGLLLYSTQTDSGENTGGDFVALGLKGRRLFLQVNLGSGVLSLAGPLVTLDQWQDVHFSRSGQEVTLQVGSQSAVRGITPGSSNGLDLQTPLWVGWVPKTVQLHSEVTFVEGFDGCIHQIKVGNERSALLPWTLTQQSLAVTQCDLDPCVTRPCLNGGQCQMVAPTDVRCLCPQGIDGQRCQSATGPVDLPHVSVDGYLAFRDVLSASPQLTMTLRVRPLSHTGLLLYNTLRNDFFALYLRDGHIMLTFDLGSGAVTLKSPEPVSLRSWHRIRCSRNQRVGELEVNDEAAVRDISPGPSQQQEVGELTYVGGVPATISVADAVPVTDGFEGCIESLLIEGNNVDVKPPDEGYGITDCVIPACETHQCSQGSTCRPSTGTDQGYECLCPAGLTGELCEQTPCEAEPEDQRCQNSGTCVLGDQGQAHCLCTLMYTGPSCTQDLRFTVASLSGESFLAYNKTKFLGPNYFGAQMVFRTSETDGLLIWLGETSNNYLSVGLQNGFAEFRVKLEGEVDATVITSTLTRLNTNEWFQLNVEQSGMSLSLEVTDSSGQASAYTGRLPGADQKVDTSEDRLYIGGLPGDVSTATEGTYTRGLKGCVIQLMGASRKDQWSTLQLQQEALDGRGIDTCQV